MIDLAVPPKITTLSQRQSRLYLALPGSFRINCDIVETLRPSHSVCRSCLLKKEVDRLSCSCPGLVVRSKQIARNQRQGFRENRSREKRCGGTCIRKVMDGSELLTLAKSLCAFCCGLTAGQPLTNVLQTH